MKLVIMTTLYNAEKYIQRCIETVRNQTFKNFLMVITDDMSNDSSKAIVKDLIKDDNRFILIENQTKFYQPGNYWQISRFPFVDDEDVLVTVDGDDFLPDQNVLGRVFGYYFRTNFLMTFGQFIHFHGGDKYSQGFTSAPDFNILRGTTWTTSHLRTFKAKVFRKILEKDLKSPTGNFWEVTGDQAIIYPMLEMVGREHVYFTNDINYVYNVETELNDFKVNGSMQQEYSNLIRAKQRYPRLF